MKTRKNEIEVYRGESFTIHKRVVNKDGSPYIISSEFQNPFFLLSVSNSVYSQSERLVSNYWLSLKNYPRFYLTEPLELHDIKADEDGSIVLYNNFEDVTEFPIRGYLNGEFVQIPPEYAVFHCNGEYMYWNDKWVTYSCDIVKTFLSEDTASWIPQEYFYSIQLVDGQLMESYLRELCIMYGIEYVGIEESYIMLFTNFGHRFPVNFNITQPLGKIDTSYAILAPTSLKVIEYAQGDL